MFQSKTGTIPLEGISMEARTLLSRLEEGEERKREMKIQEEERMEN